MLSLTPDEHREDLRSTEGDPALRSRRRRLARSWRATRPSFSPASSLVLTGAVGADRRARGRPPPRARLGPFDRQRAFGRPPPPGRRCRPASRSSPPPPSPCGSPGDGLRASPRPRTPRRAGRPLARRGLAPLLPPGRRDFAMLEADVIPDSSQESPAISTRKPPSQRPERKLDATARAIAQAREAAAAEKPAASQGASHVRRASRP